MTAPRKAPPTSTKVSATIVHRDDPACTEGPREMMGDGHRTGCSNGRTCPSRRDCGGAPRATWYARHRRVWPDGKAELRGMYFCERCARNWAHRFGLDLPVSA